ncbi:MULTISPECIES: signal peptidase I [Mesobacillus]|uniref:signal peptidase I n=1 Tax=Mesobacillus TaxID=2675231 RepID=UPI0017876E9E|nr:MULTISPECIES: signal peptidase I [Mesobacillus]MCM3572420.1 signal peptidase I [Mesobacillus subterraneus]UYZ23893.1 signal peptidase I [Mesobacillus jeotgali]
MVKERNEIWEWVKALLIAIVLAFVVRAFLMTPIEVKGASMEPTLHSQERMFVTKIGEPKRFDIVVFHATEDKDYIKRVIGLPGDRVEYKDDVLYINGKPYDEPYLEENKKQVAHGPLTGSFTLSETPVGSDVVPEGHIFVLGDNRRDSRDSRHIGAVPIDSIVGTTKFVYYPFKKMKIIGE